MLSRQEAAKALPAHVRGVVTWKGGRDALTIEDDTAGIWVHVTEARKRGLWATDNAVLNAIRVGQVVEIEGVSDPAGYAPVLVPKLIRVVGEGILPAARPMVPTRFFSGADDSLRIEVRGVVQGFQRGDIGWMLQLYSAPGRFTVEISRTALADPEVLVDAEVRVTGVAISRFNTRGELTLPRVFCSQPGEIVVETPAAAPFAAPLVPLDQILPFRPDPLGPHRLRVIGTVTYALPGKFLYLQDGATAVRVETRSPEPWQPGDRVEAAGFVEMTRFVGSLAETQVRKIGRGVVPEAVAMLPEKIVALNRAAMSTGQLAKPHDFDGHLVRFPARLLAVQSAPDAKQPWRRLTLEQGEMILGATLHAGDAAALDALRPGSELEVTALVQLEYAPVNVERQALVPTRLDVILRRADEVRVVQAPTWWTPERLLAAMALVVAALGGALLWAWQLRRQVGRKTQLLAAEMSARRDAAIEFQATLRERNRLAANLHDTLLQTLGGIGFQMGACEDDPAVHLPVAQKMLEHAVDELRGSVWALRSLPLHGLALPEALRSIAERAGAGQAVQIEVRTDGDLAPVPDFVAGNLLLVAQEALHNALKHAHPRTVTIEVRFADTTDRIALTVRDDGDGFTPGAQAGAAQGHFGVTGMRERIERLHGTFRLDSAPGRGTTLAIEVPLRTYDEELA